MTTRVYLEFRTSKLQKGYLQAGFAEKTWGEQVARHYVKAINLVKAAHRPSDLRAFPQFGYEALAGDRKGQHSLKLGYRERLIFTVHPGPEGLTARIEEVSIGHYER